VLPAQTISQQGLAGDAALRDFDPAYVGLGSMLLKNLPMGAT
jgi:hypothetical protein